MFSDVLSEVRTQDGEKGMKGGKKVMKGRSEGGILTQNQAKGKGEAKGISNNG